MDLSLAVRRPRAATDSPVSYQVRSRVPKSRALVLHGILFAADLEVAPGEFSVQGVEQVAVLDRHPGRGPRWRRESTPGRPG